MKKNITLSIVLVLITFITCYELAISYSSTPPASRTGAPGEGNCTTSGCHNGTPNTGPGNILFSLDTINYIPGNTYTAAVQVVDGTKLMFGFELTALDSTNTMAGSYIITNTINTSAQTSVGRDYVNHLNANSSNSWQFDWTAPSSNVGPITFYIAGNAANDDGDESGDNIYTRTFTVQPYIASLAVNVIGVDVLCKGESTGSAVASPLGGTTPYSYAWSSGGSTSTETGLVAGTYLVTITDATPTSVVGSVTIGEPALALTVSLSSVLEVICNGDSSGVIVVSGLGGTGNYEYMLDTIGASFQTNATFSNLTAGSYEIIIRDGNLCQSTLTSVTLSEPVAITIDSISSITATCISGDGSFTVYGAKGGSGTLEFKVDTPGAVFQADSGFSGLYAGIYNVIIRDSVLCTLEATVIIGNSNAPILSINSFSDVQCNSDSTGAIAVSSTGGSGSNTFSINGSAFQSDSIFSGLYSGNYNILVQDGNGCIGSVSQIISEPFAMILAGGSNPENTGSSDGSAWVTVSGGTSPYTYLWNDLLQQLDNTATGLIAGNYTVEVTDNNGCMKSTIINVSVNSGVLEELSVNLIQIMPVPAKNVLVFKGILSNNTLYTLEIRSISGKLLYRNEVRAKTKLIEETIDLSQYEAGIYFLTFTATDLAITRKFIKTH